MAPVCAGGVAGRAGAASDRREAGAEAVTGQVTPDVRADADLIREGLRRSETFTARSASEAFLALDRLLSRLDTLERERADESDLEHQTARRIYWRRRAEAAEARLRAAEETLREIAGRQWRDDEGRFAAAIARDRLDALAGVQAPATLTGGGDEGGTATAREPTSGVAPAVSAGVQAPAGESAVVWSEPRQQYPGGPVYREGMATGTGQAPAGEDTPP